MSYTVDLIVTELPAENRKAWAVIEEMRGPYYDDKRETAPSLVSLHAVLTSRYPCLSSYSGAYEGPETCPWADGPMINNFAHEMGMLAISFSRVDEIVPFIIEKANALGITVADGQSGLIHRPDGSLGIDGKKKAWWKLW